jgi:hypothetical protein
MYCFLQWISISILLYSFLQNMNITVLSMVDPLCICTDMPLSSRCLSTSFWGRYLWFKQSVHGHRICSASLNLSLMKSMKDFTPPIYWGVNSTPCTQRLSIYNKNCRGYILPMLEQLHGLTNYNTELKRESKFIPDVVEMPREVICSPEGLGPRPVKL